MAGAASQAGDADSSRAPGLASGLQGSMNVHRGALLLVPQWQCISSFVFYITVSWLIPFKYEMIYTKEEIYMSYTSMNIYNIYSILFINVYIVCIIIYMFILYVGIG